MALVGARFDYRMRRVLAQPCAMRITGADTDGSSAALAPLCKRDRSPLNRLQTHRLLPVGRYPATQLVLLVGQYPAMQFVLPVSRYPATQLVRNDDVIADSDSVRTWTATAGASPMLDWVISCICMLLQITYTCPCVVTPVVL